MKIIRLSSKEEFELEFLKGEWDDATFNFCKPHWNHLVESPNLKSLVENKMRHELLWGVRAGLLKYLPKTLHYVLVSLTHQDLQKCYLINESSWSEGFGEHCQGHRAAQIFVKQRQRKKWVGPHMQKIHTISQRFDPARAGQTKLLGLGATFNWPITILDGNHRLVAYCEKRYEEVDMILGVSKSNYRNPWFNNV